MAASDIKVVADFTDLQLMRRELVGVSKDAKTSAGVFEREFNKVSRALSISAKSTQVFYNSTLKVDSAAKSAATSAKVFEAALKKHDATLKKVALSNRRLRMEYKDGYAAQVKLRLEQMRLSQAKRRGIITTDQYRVAMANLTITQDKATVASSRTRRAMGHSSVITQQAGYQIGDFLVQVQSGTNAMVAFGQQATQVAGTLTILGGKWIGIGTALGISIPLFTAVAAYFMRTAKAQKEVADGAQELESAFNNLNSATKDLSDSVEEYNDVLMLSKSVANSDFTPLLKNLSQEIAARKTLLNVERERFKLQQFTLKQEVAGRKKVIDALFRTSNAMRDTALSNATSEQERLQIQKTYLEDTRRIIEANKEVFLTQREQTAQLALVDALLLRNNDNLDEAVKHIEAFADVDPAAGVREAAKAAQILASNLGISLRAAMAMQGMISTRPTQDVFDPRDPRHNSSESALERTRRLMEGGTLGDPTLQGVTTASGSSGASPTASTNTEASLGLETYQKALKEVIALEEQRKALIEPMATAFTDSFTSIVDGTMSVEGAFKDMSRKIVAHLWEVFVVQSLINSITGVFGGGSIGSTAIPKNNPLAGMSGSQMLPQANGGAWNNGVQMFANGGVVNSPTMFGHSGGLGMMGEAGPEAIMPLKRGSNGKLGVQMEGGGQSVVINQSFNFSANGDDSVKKIIAQAAPQIAQMTQKSMMDQRRRGGSMKSTFG